jgi:AcrR family transcriptional regulator
MTTAALLWRSPEYVGAPPAGPGKKVTGHTRPWIDGRHLRSLRTQQQIIEAFLALLQREPVPKAAVIAEHAGCSVRAVYDRFPTMAALRVAAVDYAFAQAAALAPARHIDADRGTRIRSHVETQAQLCERGTAVWRLLLAAQNESEELRHRLRLARQRTVARLELMFGPELATLSDLERSRLVIALEALTDPEGWARMRGDRGLSFADACDVWIVAIDRLLPGAAP